MKKLVVLFLLIFGLIISGCSNNETNEIPKLVDVKISVSPEEIKANEDVTINATVTQGNENVDDADEVLFEIWKDGNDDHEKIEGELEGKGVYSITRNFSEAGTYNIIAHVTARSLHTMPKIQVEVK